MVAFKMVVSVAFSKHVIHYGPQSGFPYCNLTTHIYRAIPIHYLRWGRVNLCPETLTRNQSLYQNAGRLEPKHRSLSVSRYMPRYDSGPISLINICNSNITGIYYRYVFTKTGAIKSTSILI
jgi:hypothetical protein